MTDHTAKNLVGRDLINLRDALTRCRPYVEAQSDSTYASELLMRINTLIYRHADHELDLAKMWAAGDYRAYPIVEGISVQHEDEYPQVRAWVTNAANELASHFSFGVGPDSYVTDEQRQNVADNYAAIITKHYEAKS